MVRLLEFDRQYGWRHRSSLRTLLSSQVDSPGRLSCALLASRRVSLQKI